MELEREKPIYLKNKVKRMLLMENEITLNVGTNFRINQIERFAELNKRYEGIRIGSVFGSLRTDVLDLPSARPDFRLAETDQRTFELFVSIARKSRIEVEYAANATLNNNIIKIHEDLKEIISQFRYLESVGVTRVILSNPLLMEIVSEYTNLKIKVSTVVGINKPNAIKHYSRLNVDNICPDIYINRNFALLKDLQKVAFDYNIKVELLANEVCFYGDVPCNNVLRTACYEHSSMGGNPLQLFNNWPFQRCQAEREKSSSCWLKIPFILPQHIKKYSELTGITRFKVSGRTNTETYLFWIIEKYMAQKFEGEIRNLFMLPQNNVPTANFSITIEDLEKEGFFSSRFNGDGCCNYNCHECCYCDKIYEKLRLKYNFSRDWEKKYTP